MKLLLAMGAIVACTVCANVLLKLGAAVPDSHKLFFRLLGWMSVAGLCFYAVAGLTYAWVLKWIPLHLAQAIVAAQFIGVILASWLILSEQINPMQWLGIALIAVGILVTGWNYRPA